jgi:predicted lipoprotein with Yx(FWY)xxD motif
MMLLPRLSLIALFCALVIGGSALAQGAPQLPSAVHVTKRGSQSVLTGAGGMTLYTSNSDPPGKSMCNGACATDWPPLTASADAKLVGDFTIIARDDGTPQWAYKGQPPLLLEERQGPGDTTGQGVGNGRWQVAYLTS